MQDIGLSMYGNEVSIGSAIFISIFAMLIVFIVLLLISFMIDITAIVLKCMSDKGKKPTVDKKIDTAPVMKSNVDSITDVAVIAAAIAAYMGVSVDNIRISKIRRVDQNISLWAERGLLTQYK